MLIPKPLILFIDAYDSFSNNIISLLETTLDASVRTIHIDNPALTSDWALHKELRHYAAVVCGPGPGHPANKKDVGVMRRIWRLADEEMVPVLGICLGFQSLCLEFGGKVMRLKGPQHGIVRRITHAGETGALGADSLFAGVGEINATLYQSLCADIGQDSISKECWQTTKWVATNQCPDLLPLAWVEHDLAEENNSGIMDERVLVAVCHKTKPFWALQYHPESICTNDESKKVILNWFRLAQSWNSDYRQTQINLEGQIEGRFATRESLLSQSQRMLEATPTNGSTNTNKVVCHSRSIDIPARVSVQSIAEAILDMREDQILLESSNANEKSAGGADVRGRYSIVGLDIKNCMKVEYTAEQGIITTYYPGANSDKPQIRSIDASTCGGIWPYLAQHLDKNRLKDGNLESPFWGGFMGYATYELGLETIRVTPNPKGRQHQRPDLCFTWVKKSLVVDHAKNKMYIQRLAPEIEATRVSAWMDDIAAKLEANFFLNKRQILDKMVEMGSTLPCRPKLHNQDSMFTGFATSQSRKPAKPSSNPNIPSSVLSIHTPSNDTYESKVLACQSSIRAGDSYELCLTDQTRVKIRTSSSWSLYTTLRTRQPAPFASYIRLGPLTYISASPERFLSYTPQTSELRPMKGTVRKSATVSTLPQAQALLEIPKEKAENLMIVDLVRHDLHGICGAGNVSVPRLMVVEEYKSVFQMISVVRAGIPAPFPADLRHHLSTEAMELAEGKRYTGLDILAASLPPGSMTGAPKKRSCEILQHVEEGKERSLYSGVVGYADVGGRGDWSVNIRCAFKWDDEDRNSEGESGDGGEETWHIGAGGAVTALSTPVGEREEMLTKLSGTLGLFR
ncbi:ADC synthase [Rhexocercosporidium sp. MPI-PUGE-AT-0058]|nr:ADC synthase [Rhexocercosporidium sp. MPI-PUGE-AT-0058]